MTYASVATTMREMADVLDSLPDSERNQETGMEVPEFKPERVVGAGAMLCYIRDLLTASPHENYNRVDILVLLEMISRDSDILPCGIGVMMWDED